MCSTTTMPVAIAPAWGASENRPTPCAQGVLARWRFSAQRLAAGAHRHTAPQDRRVADHRQPQPPAARVENLGSYRGGCWYRLLWTPVTQGGHHGRGGIQRLAERDRSTDAAAAATGLADVGLDRGFGLR